MKLFTYLLISFVCMNSLLGSAKQSPVPETSTSQKKENHRGSRNMTDTATNWFIGTHLRLLDELENIKGNQQFNSGSRGADAAFVSRAAEAAIKYNDVPTIKKTLSLLKKHYYGKVDKTPRELWREHLKKYKRERVQQLETSYNSRINLAIAAFNLALEDAHKEFQEDVQDTEKYIDMTYELGGESENEEDKDELTLARSNTMPTIPHGRLVRTKTHPKSQKTAVTNIHTVIQDHIRAPSPKAATAGDTAQKTQKTKHVVTPTPANAAKVEPTEFDDEF